MKPIADKALRSLYFVAGCVCVALGIIGAFLPLMPTTVFILIAAWCFMRSSPHFHHWLTTHPRFGKMIRDWNERGAIPVGAKILATVMILSSMVSLWWLLELDYLRYGLPAGLTCVMAFILTRPSA